MRQRKCGVFGFDGEPATVSEAGRSDDDIGNNIVAATHWEACNGAGPVDRLHGPHLGFAFFSFSINGADTQPHLKMAHLQKPGLRGGCKYCLH